VDPLSEAVLPHFEILARDGAARRGRLHTAHGVLETPAFLPVGTFGAVRGIAPSELVEIGVQGVLTNTYHLHLRPGEETVAQLGGLHAFMGWDGPILTDSGGFQVHSLDHLCRRSEEGVEFKSPIDGSTRQLTPESCIGIQETLGADLIVTLDEFEPIRPDAPTEDAGRVREMMERTLRWAARCRDAQRRPGQLLFGIIQGGGLSELRAESAARMVELGFDAFAIGGLGVGESLDQRNALVEASLPSLPDGAPRYLMGLGQPGDLIEAVCRGVDLFDCVVPTRDGRHGSVFTRDGRINLRNARFRDDADPIDPECPCPGCARYSRAYLRHLLRSGDPLAQRLLSLHNLTFYMRLMRKLREATRDNELHELREGWLRRYSSAAPHNAA
jgi:queuine tRNA-ribosyltransferase